MEKKYSKSSQGLLFLKLASLLALIVGIFVFTESSMPSFSISSSHLDNNSTPPCHERLDELDRIFNQRRDARIEQIGSLPWQRSWYDLFEPEAVCFSDERFGSEKRYTAFGDGPKFICGLDFIALKSNSSEGCLVYSVGSNNDIGFEVGIKKIMGCETLTFDPALIISFVEGGGGKLYTDLSTEGDGMVGGTSIETMLQELRQQNRTIDVMRIDCEGCEWTALPPLFGAIAAGEIMVDQMLVRLNFPPSAEATAVVFLAADKAKLRVFHKERNMRGIPAPNENCCTEYAFVSESFLRKANGEIICLSGYGVNTAPVTSF